MKKNIYGISLVLLLIGIMSICVFIENKNTTEIKSVINSQKIVINEVMTDNSAGLEDGDGESHDWIEIWNHGDNDVNLEEFGLSDDTNDPYKWKFPNVEIKADSYLILIASGKNKKDNKDYLHTNFSLNKKGDQVILTNNKGEKLDSFKIPKLTTDVSCGRKAIKRDEYAILGVATPGKSNSTSILRNIQQYENLSKPIFSKEAGYYKDEFELELSCEYNNAKIYYTLDGSEPDENSYLYKEPIKITSRAGEENKLAKIRTNEKYSGILWEIGSEEVYKGTVVRARIYKDGTFSDKIATNTYFINPDYTLPIVSIATEEDNLFGYENGIYVPGKIYDTWKAQNKDVSYNFPVPTNYNQRGKEWERKANLELFEDSGERVINQNVGIRISGVWSRMNYCKSLRVFARGEYDENEYINYNIFTNLKKNGSDEDLSSFKTLLLRTGKNEIYNQVTFKDGLMQELIKDLDLDTQAYRPTILFINGEYWGIHNIREDINEYYLEANYNINKEDIVISSIAKNRDKLEVYFGNNKDINDYDDMIKFIDENDMSTDENYDYIKTKMDIDNFIKYTVSEMYFGNTDWPHNNIKVWRKKKNINDNKYEDGLWRWAVYDLDRGFENYETNSIDNALNATYKDNIVREYVEFYIKDTDMSIDWEAANKNCLPLKKLMENDEFKSQFLNTFNTYLDTIFSEEVVVNKINEMAEVIRPEINEHYTRWQIKPTKVGSLINKIRGVEEVSIDFDEEVDKLIDFAEKRPTYLKKILKNYE